MPPRVQSSGSTKKRFDNPQWVASMGLSLDYNYAMADFVGQGGLQESQLAALAGRFAALHQQLGDARAAGSLGFMELPYQTDLLKEIKKVGKPALEWCWDLVVLGIGGSALGAQALMQALAPPQHNKFPMARRQHRLGLWVLDNIDPDYVFGILDGLELKRVSVNVISKSGATAETLSQFLWLYELLKSRLGEDQARERLIVTTDPDRGPLRQLAAREGFASLPVPSNVGGRFSVLSAVGLLPASLAGIDVEELLAGARFMDQRLQGAAPERNPAYLLAGLYYLLPPPRSGATWSSCLIPPC
jgi:glucose-6-phosphate isomerase